MTVQAIGITFYELNKTINMGDVIYVTRDNGTSVQGKLIQVTQGVIWIRTNQELNIIIGLDEIKEVENVFTVRGY
jgi:hypothetical protein